MRCVGCNQKFQKSELHVTMKGYLCSECFSKTHSEQKEKASSLVEAHPLRHVKMQAQDGHYYTLETDQTNEEILVLHKDDKIVSVESGL